MIDQIHPRDLSAWFQQHTGSASAGMSPVVLDVREPWEVQMAPAPADGFKLQCIPMREVPARLNELDASVPVACLCHHGMRSMQVAAFLRQRGFETLANIAGGIDAWAQIDARVVRY